jgi:hypothetical protein
VAVHDARVDGSRWGAWFSRMIAGGLIFRYRRPDFGGVHRV